MQTANNDETARGVVLEQCKRDMFFWIYNFAWTYNPRLQGDKYIPFIPYPFQHDYMARLKERIENAKEGETFGVEKCRDMGVSWMVLTVFFWFWLFRDSHDFLIGSRKEEYVDKKKLPDTLFGKLDILLRRLPDWMVPKGFDDKVHNTHLALINPERKSMIKGESSNSDFSRSGRYRAVLLDEFAFWENAETAYSAASESCNLIIPVSTPNPKGSGYFKYLVDNQEKYSFVRMEHHLHPRKDHEWLKAQYKTKSDAAVAVEILIDYMGAITGKVYSTAMQVEVNEKYDYDPELPLYRSWDFGHGGSDPTAIIWFQKDPKSGKVRIIDCYEKANEDILYFAPIALGRRAISSEFLYPEADMAIIDRHSEWKAGVDFGDPYSLNQTQIRTTIGKELESVGIYVQVPDKLTSVAERIEKGRLLMKRLVCHPRAISALEKIAMARFPDREGVQTRNKPIHDHTSHYRTAYEYFADMEGRLLGKPKARKPIPSKYNSGSRTRKKNDTMQKILANLKT